MSENGPVLEHPDDDRLEDYVLSRLGADQAAVLEQHLLICDGCRERLVAAETYVTAMRQACRDWYGQGIGWEARKRRGAVAR